MTFFIANLGFVIKYWYTIMASRKVFCQWQTFNGPPGQFFCDSKYYVNSNPGTYLEFYFNHCKPSYFDNIRSLLTKKLVAVKHQTFKCGMQWLFNYLIIFQNIYFWFKSPIYFVELTPCYGKHPLQGMEYQVHIQPLKFRCYVCQQ